MIIENIPFSGKSPRAGQTDLTHSISNLSGLSNGKFPKPVRLWGHEYHHFCLSTTGVIVLGSWHSWLYSEVLTRKTIPASLEEFSHGGIIVPFGEPQRAYGCGTHEAIWADGDKVILSFTAKTPDMKRKLMYQVHLPTDDSGVIEFHYLNVHTGIATVVGAKSPDGETIEWNMIKESYPYSRVALRIYTSAKAAVAPPPTKPTDPPREGFEWRQVSTAVGKVWQQVRSEATPPTEPAGAWKTVYVGVGYRVQELDK